MTDSRTKNTKRNIVASLINTSISLLFRFISRSVLIYFLGEEYLGLSSLFTSVLQVLNMAELGFSGAIVYNMYKPLAENNLNTVCALLAYYRRIYRTIGTIILIAGVVVAPFIPKLIKGSYPNDINIYVLYSLYLANTVISYFLYAYKASLLEAIQRMDILKVIYTVVSVFQYTLQILSLALFHNYYLYVVVMIAGTATQNIIAAVMAKKFYPEYECRGEISSATKKDIISRVKGLMICNISGVTYTTFDSIILSSFVGLKAVARYNNYVTVMQGVTTIITLVRSAMQASVGNSIAKESIQKNYNDMLLWQFLFSAISSWCVACMAALYQPFMIAWMGNDKLLPMIDVIFIVCWFNVTSVQHSYLLYLSGNGLWWELRWPYIWSTVSNLVLNIILGKYFGITGIIFATLFSTTVFGLVWQCIIIFKKYFHISAKEFFKKQICYFAVSILVAFVTYRVSIMVPIDGWIGLLIKAIVSAILATLLLIVIYFKTPIFAKAKTFIIKARKA